MSVREDGLRTVSPEFHSGAEVNEAKSLKKRPEVFSLVASSNERIEVLKSLKHIACLVIDQSRKVFVLYFRC